MFAADRASRDFMQMELLGCEPGRADMRMTVRAEQLARASNKPCKAGTAFTT